MKHILIKDGSMQICTTSPNPIRKYGCMECARCSKNRRLKFFLTRSGRRTKVCDKCRSSHVKNVSIKGNSTTLTSLAMGTIIECQKCGFPTTVKDMKEHRKACIKISFYDIPGLAPPGMLAETD